MLWDLTNSLLVIQCWSSKGGKGGNCPSTQQTETNMIINDQKKNKNVNKWVTLALDFTCQISLSSSTKKTCILY